MRAEPQWLRRAQVQAQVSLVQHIGLHANAACLNSSMPQFLNASMPQCPSSPKHRLPPWVCSLVGDDTARRRHTCRLLSRHRSGGLFATPISRSVSVVHTHALILPYSLRNSAVVSPCNGSHLSLCRRETPGERHLFLADNPRPSRRRVLSVVASMSRRREWMILRLHA